jgi:anti-sigma B factor antagonist
MLNDGERIDVSPERGHEPPSGRFQIDDSAGAVVIRPKMPRVDIEVAGQFRAALLQLVEQGHRRLVVDMSEVSFIDSSGLGALVSALKALKTQGRNGDIRLAGVQQPVVALLEIIRLQRVFTSYPSVELAVGSFS